MSSNTDSDVGNCPKCGARFVELAALFNASDRTLPVEFDCPPCGAELIVERHFLVLEKAMAGDAIDPQTASHDKLTTRDKVSSSSQPTPPASAWQQIETAPRDGTRVLVFGYDDPRWQLGPIVARTLDRFDGWYSLPGKHHVKPTHWMPLPPSPEVK